MTACLTLLTAVPLPAQTQGNWPGRVIVCGGGDLPRSVFLRCLAGNKGRVLIVPQAYPIPEDAALGAREEFEEAGASSIEIISKNEQEAIRQLKRNDVLWFTGGDQNLLLKAYRGTKILKVMLQRNRQGMVVGGTSAGASGIGDLMPTGQGNPKLINPATGNPRIIDPKAIKIDPGMGFLRGVIVDQHFIQYNRFNRGASSVLAHPDHVCIGVVENSAVEFRGKSFTIIAGQAAFFEGGRPHIAYMLQKGEQYRIRGNRLRMILPDIPIPKTERSYFAGQR